MKFITRLRRERAAELLTDDGLQAQLKHALEQDPLREEAERIVRSHCEPIPCDIEDNYVCARHRRA